MTDPQHPQGEKPRRPRPFGSFLLFLTVLVVVLVAFGGATFRAPELLTQDEFEWNLYMGQVKQLEFKGATGIEGTFLVDQEEKPFTTSFTSTTEREEEYQQLHATQYFIEINQEHLEEALAKSDFRPEAHRHVSWTGGDEGSQPPVPGEELPLLRRDRFFVGGTARSTGYWPNTVKSQLPDQSGKVWFVISEASDLGSLKDKLVSAGSVAEERTYDLSTYGTTHKAADPTLGLILLTWGPWLLIFAVIIFMLRQVRNQGTGAGVMSFGRSRAQIYSKESHTNVTFDDVAGAQEAKDEVREVVEFLKNPGRFTEIGGRIPRGVLLVGPPGCGKTLLAKAIAGEAEVPFYSISGSDFVEMFVGVGASRVRDLFKQARENSPCIIFLDEIDAVGRRRGSGMGGGHDEREQTLNAILVEMDGFGTDGGIIVVAATNRPDVLDPALLRPGRFDREVSIDLPDLEGREGILAVHLRKVKVADEVDSKALAKATPGYSGADLAAIVNEAAIMAVLEKRQEIHMHHLEEATAKIRFGRKKTSCKIEEDDLQITAYHEAGHTVVAAKLHEVDMPHKVTIVPRGRALGATVMLPEKESYHMQKKRLLGQLAMAFGGRVAEETFVGDISAGASDDIRRATELARAMVTELGMSEKVGPINYADRQGSDFLGTELLSGKWHSEETAHIIDKEIERILRDSYEHAREIIHAERPAMERLTQALLMYETLEAQEIMRLIEGVEPAALRPEAPIETPEDAAAKDATRPAQPEDGEEFGGFPGNEPGLSPA